MGNLSNVRVKTDAGLNEEVKIEKRMCCCSTQLEEVDCLHNSVTVTTIDGFHCTSNVWTRGGWLL